MSLEETAKKLLEFELPEGENAETIEEIADLKTICEQWAEMKEFCEGIAIDDVHTNRGWIYYLPNGKFEIANSDEEFDSPLSAYKSLKGEEG